MLAPAEINDLLPYLTIEERKELDALLEKDDVLWRPLPGPQTMAYYSNADVIGYGGAAGGGKTDLIAGLTINKHKRSLVVRREKAQTEGVIQRLIEILDSGNGYSSQKSIWKFPTENKALVEFGGLDNPNDHKRWQGRPHDLKAFDEVTEMREYQVRFVMGWARSNDPLIKPKTLMTFNPPTTVEGQWVLSYYAPWLDAKHPNPAQIGELRWYTTIKNKDVEVDDGRSFVLDGDNKVYDYSPKDFKPEHIIIPKSRTFIPARVTDNPYYMATGYMSTLQSLPEPLRSQMLYGDFKAGVQDDIWQLYPTAWVDIAMNRWKPRLPKPPMDSLGVDVARGGRDKTILAPRHGWWFDNLIKYEGRETPDGDVVAGQVFTHVRDGAVIHIDVIGVGASPYDILKRNMDVIGVNVSHASTARDKTGTMTFKNMRSELGWRLREALDPAANNGIELPPAPELKAALCSIKWSYRGEIIVASKDEIKNLIGRSPDEADAVILALIDTPKRAHGFMGNTQNRVYDPLAVVDQYRQSSQGRRSHDPFA
jgi:hypothetical protein